MTTQVLPRDDFEGLNMTMPNERTRAVIQTGEFQLELSQDVGADAELTQLPRCHSPSLIPCEPLLVLGLCRSGGGSVLRRHGSIWHQPQQCKV